MEAEPSLGLWLYEDGPARNAKAPILIAQFEGSLDAGSAGTLAVVQLLKSLSAQRVATFNSDALIDYRSHRPIMEVNEWVTADVASPEIALDLVHDDLGNPILVLHGPEPDAKWSTFAKALEKLLLEAGVEAVFSFHGLPAAVPHTRPATVHIQSTDRELVPQQPAMGNSVKIPAPFTSFLQHELHQRGLTGVTLLVTVPYYLSASTFPRASSALLRKLSEMADLSLPIGDLERGADEDAGQVDQIVANNQDLAHTVESLEHHFDAIVGMTSQEVDEEEEGRFLPLDQLGLGSDFTTWDVSADDDAELGVFPEAELIPEDAPSLADAIGDAIEGYLKTRSKHKRRTELGQPETLFTNGRTSTRTTEPGSFKPRHRAPKPWEKDQTEED